MTDIKDCANLFKNLLDIEYEFVLGKKSKTIKFSVFFEKQHFFHIAGLQHLKDLSEVFTESRNVIFDKFLKGIFTNELITKSDFYSEISDRIDFLPNLEPIFDSNDTIFKYNSKLDVFSAISADFLLKTPIQNKNTFTFLSKDDNSNKYFCRSFFPESDKDYSKNQTTWTLLFKKKIHKSTKIEEILFKHHKYNP